MAFIAVPFKEYADQDTEPGQGDRLYMTGRYMYHCHVLEHEDHEMMRPFVVMPPEVIDHMHSMGHGMDGAAMTPFSGRASGWYMPPDIGHCTSDMVRYRSHSHAEE